MCKGTREIVLLRSPWHAEGQRKHMCQAITSSETPRPPTLWKPAPLASGPPLPAFVFFTVWLVARICSHMYFLPPPPEKPGPQGRALVSSVPSVSLGHRLMVGSQ